MVKDPQTRRGDGHHLRWVPMSSNQDLEVRLRLLWDVEANIEGRTYRSAVVMVERLV